MVAMKGSVLAGTVRERTTNTRAGGASTRESDVREDEEEAGGQERVKLNRGG